MNPKNPKLLPTNFFMLPILNTFIGKQIFSIMSATTFGITNILIFNMLIKSFLVFWKIDIANIICMFNITKVMKINN